MFALQTFPVLSPNRNLDAKTLDYIGLQLCVAEDFESTYFVQEFLVLFYEKLLTLSSQHHQEIRHDQLQSLQSQGCTPQRSIHTCVSSAEVAVNRNTCKLLLSNQLASRCGITSLGLCVCVCNSFIDQEIFLQIYETFSEYNVYCRFNHSWQYC